MEFVIHTGETDSKQIIRQGLIKANKEKGRKERREKGRKERRKEKKEGRKGRRDEGGRVPVCVWVHTPVLHEEVERESVS